MVHSTQTRFFALFFPITAFFFLIALFFSTALIFTSTTPTTGSFCPEGTLKMPGMDVCGEPQKIAHTHDPYEYDIPKSATGTQVISLNPQDPIQNAINALQEGGGTIILQKGTWEITQSLELYSNITLRGMGTSSIITIPGTANFPLIINKNENMANVRIENLTLHGSLRDDEMHYGAKHHSDSEFYSNIGRKFVFGILFRAFGNNQMRNITITDIEVSRCAMGIHAKGMKNLTINDCNLYDNGAIETYYHNLYIRRVYGARIFANNLRKSPTGNGLNVDVCRYINASHNNASHNLFRGLRFENSNYTTIVDNIASYNGDVGIRVSHNNFGCLSNNTALENGEVDIEFRENRNFTHGENNYNRQEGLIWAIHGYPTPYFIWFSLITGTICLILI